MGKTYSILIALFLSIILWITVALSDYYSTNINVPVKVINIPEGYTVSDAQDKNAIIRIRGEGWKLADVMIGRSKNYEISAEFDSGSHSQNLNDALSDNNWLSNDVQVFGIYPEIFNYSIEKIYRKKVKVYPKIDYSFKNNYGFASNINSFPDSIYIYAPKSKLKKIDSINTNEIILQDLNQDVNIEVALEKIDDIAFEKNVIVVSFDVEKIVDKKFDNIPIEIKNLPINEELILFPNNLSAVLRGGINILGKLTSEDISAEVNYIEIIQDSLGIIKPDVSQPEFTNIIDIQPPTLKYTIKKFE